MTFPILDSQIEFQWHFVGESRFGKGLWSDWALQRPHSKPTEVRVWIEALAFLFMESTSLLFLHFVVSLETLKEVFLNAKTLIFCSC